MKNVVVLILIGLLLISCKGRTKGDTHDVKSGTFSIKRVAVPFRDHGYSNLSTAVLTSETARKELLNSIEVQSGWEMKEPFTATLAECAVNFERENIVLFVHSESSGSNRLEVSEPVLKAQSCYVRVERTVPEIGTMDMAYYSLVYIVDKTVSSMGFDISGEIVSVKNR